jgi:hypothetical protein
VVDAIVGPGVDSDTRTLIVSGVAALVLTALGRMFQSGMAYLSHHGVRLPSPFNSEGGQTNAVTLLVYALVLVVVVVLIIWLLRSV